MSEIMNAICSEKFKYIIAPIIVGVATAGLVWGNIFFYPTLQQNNQIFFSSLSVILYTMCFISFYQAIAIKNTLPNNIPKPRVKKMLRNNHPFYTEVNQCIKENAKYKPPRTSHCSACGHCVVRMDHHCPYINNCLGQKNLKAFILFTGYGGLFSLQFLLFSIKFYFDLKYGKIGPFNEGTMITWLVLTLISFFLALSMIGLSTSNIFMVSLNITQMDLMKGTFKVGDRHGLHPNPFDLGIFTNLNKVFESDKWLFWWPTEIITESDAVQYPMVPEVTFDDIQKSPQNVKDHIRTPLERLIPSTYEQLLQAQKDNYKSTIFFFLGKEYRIGDEVYNEYNISDDRQKKTDGLNDDEKKEDLKGENFGKKEENAQEEAEAQVFPFNNAASQHENAEKEGNIEDESSHEQREQENLSNGHRNENRSAEVQEPQEAVQNAPHQDAEVSNHSDEDDQNELLD